MNLSLLMATVLTVGATAFAQSNFDENFYTIKSVKVEEIAQPAIQRKAQKNCQSDSQSRVDNNSFQPSQDGIDPGQIVNIGQQIWSIIEANQPVGNWNVQKANALPLGINTWLDLECWQLPETRLVKYTYTNLFGMNVVEITLRINYTPGGRIKGQGRYLSEVTILPAQLNVMWGFKVNAAVEVANVTNAGTQSSPLAAIQMNVNWAINTPVKYSQSTESFYVRGDGFYKQLR